MSPNLALYSMYQLGDRWLDEARSLARDRETSIDPHELEIVKERLFLAEDLKIWSETKRGSSGLQQAREYCRIAKDALQLVKTVSESAANDTLGAPDLAHELPTDNQPSVNGIGTSAGPVSPSTTQELLPGPSRASYATRQRPQYNQYHVQESRTDDSPQRATVISAPFSPAPEGVPTLPSALRPTDNLASHSVDEVLTDDQQCMAAVSMSPSPSPEHIPTSVTSTPPPPASSNHVSESSPFRVLPPPDKLHPSLTCWMKNMKKLDGLVDRLQELASSAPAEHQTQLFRQVVALRATSKKQKEHFTEFLQLSEKYANKYLLDISDEIQQQSSFLDKLERRLEAAKKLHGEAADLQRLYESGTVATMKDLRATTLWRPLPHDGALFNEVDFVMAEIQRFYEELNKFWTEEIGHVVEALQKRCIDPKDIERWNNFRSSLRQTIESWKNPPPSAAGGDPRTLRCNNACSSNKPDIGAAVKSMSSAMSSLTSALDRVTLSDSVNYLRSGRSVIQGVYVAFEANSAMCHSFLRCCADYGEKMFTWCSPPIASPTSPRVGSPHNLRERTIRLWSERTGVSAKNAATVQGPRKFKVAYNEALSLEQKTTSELNVLLEKLLSSVTVTDGHGPPGEPLPDVITLKRLRERWAKAKDFMSAALVILENGGQAPEVFDRSAPLASRRPRLGSVIKRWVMNIVRF